MIEVIVIVDKFSSLRAEIEPIGDELRPIDSLFHLGTSCYHFECVPGDVAGTTVGHSAYNWLEREIKICIRAVYYLLRKFNSPPNLIRDKGIYSTWAGSILTSAGPSWDFRGQLMEHEGEDQ
jgi:hypothetical protein